jgi:hypothetical protein
MHHQEWTKEGVYKRLSAQVRSEEFRSQFQSLRLREPVLRPHESAELLIGSMRGKGARNFDGNDAILHALISVIQSKPALRGCALTLISLAMWPALEHSYYKLLRLSDYIPDLLAEIHWRFMAEVVGYNLAKRSKVAINLQLNLEKRVRESLDDEIRYQDFIGAHSFLDANLDQALDNPHQGRSRQIKEWLGELPVKELRRCARVAQAPSRPLNPEEEGMAAAVAKLTAVGLLTQDESRLITDHAIRGIELAEIARERGISSGLMRIRYHRAKAKLRPFLGGGSDHVTLEPESGVFYGGR